MSVPRSSERCVPGTKLSEQYQHDRQSIYASVKLKKHGYAQRDMLQSGIYKKTTKPNHFDTHRKHV